MSPAFSWLTHDAHVCFAQMQFWCQLENGKLTYYERKPSSQEKAVGFFQLASTTIVGRHRGMQISGRLKLGVFCFEVREPLISAVFSAPTEPEVTAWLHGMQQAVR